MTKLTESHIVLYLVTGLPYYGYEHTSSITKPEQIFVVLFMWCVSLYYVVIYVIIFLFWMRLDDLSYPHCPSLCLCLCLMISKLLRENQSYLLVCIAWNCGIISGMDRRRCKIILLMENKYKMCSRIRRRIKKSGFNWACGWFLPKDYSSSVAHGLRGIVTIEHDFKTLHY